MGSSALAAAASVMSAGLGAYAANRLRAFSGARRVLGLLAVVGIVAAAALIWFDDAVAPLQEDSPVVDAFEEVSGPYVDCADKNDFETLGIGAFTIAIVAGVAARVSGRRRGGLERVGWVLAAAIVVGLVAWYGQLNAFAWRACGES